MLIKLLVLLITSIISPLTKWRWIVTKCACFIVLIMISDKYTVVCVYALIYSPNRTITKIIWFILIIFSIHFHNNIIASWWNYCWILAYLTNLPWFLTLYFILHILIFLIVFIIITMRSSIIYLCLILAYVIGIVNTFIYSIQIYFVSIIIWTIFLLRVKCLRKIIWHKIIHHSKLLTWLICLASKLSIWFLYNRCICSKTAVSIRIAGIWDRRFSNIIHLSIGHVV